MGGRGGFDPQKDGSSSDNAETNGWSSDDQPCHSTHTGWAPRTQLLQGPRGGLSRAV